MANNINVRLTTLSNGEEVLETEDQGGQNKVSRKQGEQIISWNLTGPLAQGSFLGFSWVPPNLPPEGIFGALVIRKKSIDLSDRHEDAKSDGEWIYQLKVFYNNKTYETKIALDKGVGAAITNPVIINRDE